MTKRKENPQPAGRKPKFEASEDMGQRIQEYFDECDSRGKPYTISGLAYHLDMTTQALRDYQAKPEFLCVIKAKQKVERSVEERLFTASATGSIFWLKNHAGYKDKTEQDLNHSGEVKIDLTVNFVEPPKD